MRGGFVIRSDMDNDIIAAAENGDYVYRKKRLREIDRHARFLAKRIEMAAVVDPARQSGKPD